MIGSDVIFFENLPSTNTYAANLLRSEEVQEGTIIRTKFQSSGRGQKGNKWESEQGKNLLISIILYPKVIAASDQFLISMAISLGISDFLEKKITGCKIKWPNDIYVKNDKIAGILIENSVMDNNIINTIAGIGLNINQRIFISDAPNPVSLSIITGTEYDTDECFKELSETLDKRYNLLISGKHNVIRDDYISRLYRHGEWCQYKGSKGIFKGRLISVNDSGMVLIENQAGVKEEYSFKELDFIP